MSSATIAMLGWTPESRCRARAATVASITVGHRLECVCSFMWQKAMGEYTHLALLAGCGYCTDVDGSCDAYTCGCGDFALLITPAVRASGISLFMMSSGWVHGAHGQLLYSDLLSCSRHRADTMRLTMIAWLRNALDAQSVQL